MCRLMCRWQKEASKRTATPKVADYAVQARDAKWAKTGGGGSGSGRGYGRKV
jgi:hypothetical protein